MKPLERIGRRERAVVTERRERGYQTEWRHFDESLRPTLRALIERLLPGVPASIDIPAFVDCYAAQPLGRGDRREGMPPFPDLLVQGVAALAEGGFAEMTEQEQDQLISRLRHGEEYGELGAFAKDFVDRLLERAVTGYLAHPDTWLRIGFNGPAYPQGYAWISSEEVAARHQRRPGWDRL